MRPYRESRFAKVALIIFFILLLGYAYYEARAVVYGPRIQIPFEVMTVTDRFTEIRGQASYISELKVNGTPITVTEDGKFAEKMVLTPGENRIMLDAKDKFGRTRQEVLRIYYKPTNDVSPPSPTATTTELQN